MQDNGTRQKYFGLHQGEIYHPMIDKARVAAAAMRVATVPLKGTMTEPPARGPYNAIMEQIPKAPGDRGRSCSRSALMVKDAAHNAKAVAAAAAMSPWNDLALTGQSMKERANADSLVTEDMLAEQRRAISRGIPREIPSCRRCTRLLRVYYRFSFMSAWMRFCSTMPVGTSNERAISRLMLSFTSGRA